MSQLGAMPPALAAQSISRREIVLPLAAALECIDFCVLHRIPIYGWEGWVLTIDGRVGHGSAPQGTVCLADWPLEEAAAFCRRTMVSDAEVWQNENPETTDKLHFCMTIGDAPGSSRPRSGT
ncbi:TPA: hypothetical protein QDC20_004511 [Burkholderia aenigmatica]|nr:hypothetical protein [Burkholderia aenigmatica]HDR9594429.1 hypothetical protein [Burkholderia aenigmatica]HDR9603436.1 hypothetical protein [Burkholderia aenigmatica]HDR9611300.1 hypothetical protein [Burkholderia aenigmatica]HDR9638150.1 hypothetical protein [Burkholderia aenigmatica]